MEHTKEPWPNPEYDNDDRSSASWYEIPGVGCIYTEANARRIVACVNALEGFPTEELERTPPSVIVALEATTKIIDQRDTLRAENQRLREELESLKLDAAIGRVPINQQGFEYERKIQALEEQLAAALIAAAHRRNYEGEIERLTQERNDLDRRATEYAHINDVQAKQLAACQKDAERGRYLVDRLTMVICNLDTEDEYTEISEFIAGEHIEIVGRFNSITEALDAAIAAQKENRE